MTYSLQNLEAEMALAKKIQSLNVPCRPFTGVTTVDQRKAVVRKAIQDNGLGSVLFTVKAGKQITLASQFQKTYGESL